MSVDGEQPRRVQDAGAGMASGCAGPTHPDVAAACGGPAHPGIWRVGSGALAMLVSAALFAAARPAAARPRGARNRVVVLPVSFADSVTPGARRIVEQRLALGLKASGMELVEGTKQATSGAEPAVDGAGASDSCKPACRRVLAAKTRARYVVGGHVSGAERFYEMKLWLADGYSGKIVARAERECDICGLKALGDATDLAASALASKIAAGEKSVARVRVESDPPGALVLVDGDPVGRAPRDLELPPGQHELRARADGYFDGRRRVQAVAGVRETVSIELVERERGLSPREIWGWSALVGGIATMAAGVTLLALHGQGSDCADGVVTAEPRCKRERDMVVGGSVVLGLGSAIAATGVVLLALPGGEREGDRKTALKIAPAGPGLQLDLTF